MASIDRSQMIRQLRQRLEDLRRAGLDRLPVDRNRRFDLAAPRSAPEQAEAEPQERSEAESSGATGRSSPAVEPKPETPEPSTTHRRPARPSARPPKPEPTPASPPPLSLNSLFEEESGFDEPPMPPEQRPEALRVLAEEIAGCQRCSVLAENRTNTVPGEGNPTARLMFIGEGPGADEDETGRPFVGRAGQLLNDMITKGMGLNREDVFIANVIKCRAPNNRDPERDEVRNCIGYLERQIEIVRPEFLCLLGRPAAQTILDTAMPMGRLRQRWHRYRGIPTIATYHPAYLLRNPAEKRKAWEDLQMLMQAMGLAIPKRGKR